MSLIKVAVVPVTAYQQNCSIILCEKTKKAAVVDPGGDLDQISNALKQMDAVPEKILITHGHLDHAGGAKDLAEMLKIPIEGPHEADLFWLEGMPEYAKMMQFPPARSFVPERWLKHQDKVTVGELELDVLHCPGHTPGHVVFFHSPSKLAWVGDVLFQGSIGRTDFPQGDYQTLVNSITKRLWPLGDEVQFIPGHGPTSSFGEERQNNPFVADHRFG